MNYDLELLETLACWLQKHPSILGQEALLKDETKRLEKIMLQHLMSLTSETQIMTYLQINLYKLVEICDTLFLPNCDQNLNSSAVLDLFVSLIKTSKAKLLYDLSIPLLLRERQSVSFEKDWYNIRLKMMDLEIDNVLIEIMSFAIDNFKIAKLPPKLSVKGYLTLFCEELSEIKEDADNNYLIHLLIRLEYNYSRFTAYCFRWLKTRIDESINENKFKVILELKKEICQLEMISDDKFDNRKSSIINELCKWLDEEQFNSKYCQNQSNCFKINTKLKVLELAYWQKLQYDNGVYDEVNLDILSEKISYNFSSKFQDELSAASIKSKFYPKDRSIIEPIEVLLVKMLADVRQFLQ